MRASSRIVVTALALVGGAAAACGADTTRTEAEKRAGRSVDQAVEAVTDALGDHAADKARLGGTIKGAYAETP